MRAAGLLLVLVVALSPTVEGVQKRFENLTEEDAAKLWLDEIASYIILKHEREFYESLKTSEERVQFIDAFWKRRDPTPETPENEYQIEHYRRLAFVNKFFGSGRPGWRTDRGRIYILLGPPDVIDSDPMGRHMHQYPTEVWIYRRPPHPELPPNMEIAFVDTRLTGEYELTFNLLGDSDATRRTEAWLGQGLLERETVAEIRSMNLGRPGTMDLGRGLLPELDKLNELALVSQIPERQLRPLSEEVKAWATFDTGTLDVETQVDFYQASEGQVCIPVTLRLPYRDFAYLEREDRYEGRFDILGRILGSDGEIVDEFTREQTLAVPKDRQAVNEQALIYQLILYAPPGEYQLQTVVRDKTSNGIRTMEDTLRVPDLGEPLSLSTVVLADQIVKRDALPPPGQKDPFIFGEFEVVPNAGRSFRSRGNLNVYFEVYNLGLDEQGKNSLDLSYVFRRDGRLYRKVGNTYLYPTDRRERSVMSSIPLKDFVPGEYVLIITVTDGVTSKTATAEVPFRVS